MPKRLPGFGGIWGVSASRALAAFAVGLALIAKGPRRHLALRLDPRRTRRQARESLAQLHEAKQARARQAVDPVAAPEHTEAVSGTHPDDRLVAIGGR